MSADVAAVYVLVEVFFGHVHFASEDGFEGCLAFGEFGVFLVDVVEELFDAVHVAVVGDGDAGHSVGYGFVNEVVDGGLAVEQGVLCVDVEVDEGLHLGGGGGGLDVGDCDKGLMAPALIGGMER